MVQKEFSLDNIVKLCEKVERWERISAGAGIFRQRKAYRGSFDNFSVMIIDKFSVLTYYVFYPYILNIPSITRVLRNDSEIANISGTDSEICYRIAEKNSLKKNN